MCVLSIIYLTYQFDGITQWSRRRINDQMCYTRAQCLFSEVSREWNIDCIRYAAP
jgi:hypothetical protein